MDLYNFKQLNNELCNKVQVYNKEYNEIKDFCIRAELTKSMEKLISDLVKFISKEIVDLSLDDFIYRLAMNDKPNKNIDHLYFVCGSYKLFVYETNTENVKYSLLFEFNNGICYTQYLSK